MARNLVWLPPEGLVIALQFYQGDLDRALRLARLLADIEPRRRADVKIAFVRRFDMPDETEAMWKTRLHVGFKFPTIAVRAEQEATGHPAGANAMFASCLEQFSGAWRDGDLQAHSIFLCEADGVPLRVDWLDLLLAAHQRTLVEGKRITGPLMQRIPHVNGTLITHLSLWLDRPSLHHTPPSQAWDLFHAQAILSEARPDPWLKNIYGACNWSQESLFALSHETAWLASQKDDSAVAWAEHNLVATSPMRMARSRGCYCPNPVTCALDACRCDCGDCRASVDPSEQAVWRAEDKAKRIVYLENELARAKARP